MSGACDRSSSVNTAISLDTAFHLHGGTILRLVTYLADIGLIGVHWHLYLPKLFPYTLLLYHAAHTTPLLRFYLFHTITCHTFAYMLYTYHGTMPYVVALVSSVYHTQLSRPLTALPYHLTESAFFPHQQFTCPPKSLSQFSGFVPLLMNLGTGIVMLLLSTLR